MLALLLIFLITVPALLYYFRPSPTEAAWYSDSWKFRKKITINSSKVPSTQTNFPVLVSLTDPSLKQYARPDGNDIVFTTSAGSGTKLSHEIESYTAATGKLVAWVKVPSLSSTANTVLYMYYGNSSATNQQDVPNVWSNGFAEVWHMKEATSANALVDSTSNSINASKITANNPKLNSSGTINGAQVFDGTNNHEGFIGNVNALNFGMNSFTFSAWVYDTSDTSTYDTAVGKGAGDAGLPGFIMELGSDPWYVGAADDAATASGHANEGTMETV